MENKYQPPRIKRLFSFKLILAFGVFLGVFVLTQFLAYQQLNLFKAIQKDARDAEALAVKERIEETFKSSLSVTSALGFIVENEGVPENFDEVAKILLAGTRSIDALELFDSGTITHVYPLKGNEAAIGYDVLTDPSRNKEAFLAIKKRELYFAGPFELKQGGIGIVGRLPLFRDGKFIGFSAVLIRLNTFVKSAGISDYLSGIYRYQLIKTNINTGIEEQFFPGEKISPDELCSTVKLEEGDWNICVQNRAELGWYNVKWLSILGFVVAIFGGLMSYRLTSKSDKLRLLEVQRAFQQRNEILESIGDAFFSLDKELNITYWNKQAESLLLHKRETVLGKNLLDLFGDFINPDDIKRNAPQLAEGHALHFKQHIPRLEKWFDVSIYPFSSGTAVYFSDITESEKHVEAIEKRNEKLSEIAWIQSHIVRAPLARMMGIINLLEMGELDERESLKLRKQLLMTAHELDTILNTIVEKANLIEKEVKEVIG